MYLQPSNGAAITDLVCITSHEVPTNRLDKYEYIKYHQSNLLFLLYTIYLGQKSLIRRVSTQFSRYFPPSYKLGKYGWWDSYLQDMRVV